MIRSPASRCCASRRVASTRRATSIATAIAAFGGSRLERAPLHAAQVDIALAADDLDTAAASADEVMETARCSRASVCARSACVAQGAVALARGEGVTALASLRAACTAWNELDAPYEAARTRVLLADAYALLDDDDAADRERAAARGCFERLGAHAALRALDGDGARADTSTTHGLSPREREVLGAGRPRHHQP